MKLIGGYMLSIELRVRLHAVCDPQKWLFTTDKRILLVLEPFEGLTLGDGESAQSWSSFLSMWKKREEALQALRTNLWLFFITQPMLQGRPNHGLPDGIVRKIRPYYTLSKNIESDGVFLTKLMRHGSLFRETPGPLGRLSDGRRRFQTTEPPNLWWLDEEEIVMDLQSATALIDTSVGVIGLGFDVASFFQEGPNYTQQLNRLIELQEDMSSSLDTIEKEIQWDVVTTDDLDKAVNGLLILAKQIRDFSSVPDKSDWAKSVLNDGQNYLRTIHNSMMGTGLYPSLLQAFIGKIESSEDATQSVRFGALDFYRRILAIQLGGFVALNKACDVLGESSDSYLESHASDLGDQTKKAMDLIRGADPWWSSSEFNEENYFKIKDDYKYFDATEHRTAGDYMVGLAISTIFGNRTGLTLRSLPLAPDLRDAGAFDSNAQVGTVNMATSESDYFTADYVDLNPVELPEDGVAVGAALYQRGNRVAIKLRGEFLSQMGVFGFVPYPLPNNCDDENYYGIEGSNVYANSTSVLPTPYSFITGASLFLFHNRLAVKVKTGYVPPAP